MTEQDEILNTDLNVLLCPNCNEYFIIEQLNCGIFRHCILKENGNQIDPHSPKELCEYYIRTNKIYGCGKPFQVILVNNKFETKPCDYI
jgi:hypothetical protein